MPALPRISCALRGARGIRDCRQSAGRSTVPDQAWRTSQTGATAWTLRVLRGGAAHGTANINSSDTPIGPPSASLFLAGRVLRGLLLSSAYTSARVALSRLAAPPAGA